MTKTDTLMFRREHFPVEVKESLTQYGRKYAIFGETCLPPCHPSMQDGIDVDLAISVLDESIEETINDLQDAESKKPVAIKIWLDELKKDAETGKYYGEVFHTSTYGSPAKAIKPFPFMQGKLLCVCRDGFNDSVLDPNQVTRIEPGLVSIPEGVALPEELIAEYEMSESGTVGGYRVFSCPIGWCAKNVHPAQEIFYKNFVMAIDNEVVRRKYSK